MTAPLIPIAWCVYFHHGEVADDPQTAHTALEHHYTHHHPTSWVGGTHQTPAGAGGDDE